MGRNTSGVFWFGFTYTVILGLALLIIYWVRQPNPFDWYAVNYFAGPTIAYLAAIAGLSWQPVKVFAAMLFVVAIFLGFPTGFSMAVLNLPGLIGIFVGISVDSRLWRRAQLPA